MKRNLLIKTLAVGVIFLFIGVAVAPSTAVEIPNKEDVSLVNDTSGEDCDCQPINNLQLRMIERVVDRLESYTRILSLLSKRNPEIAEECEELSSEVSKLKEMNEDFPIFCEIYENIWNRLADLFGKIWDILYPFHTIYWIVYTITGTFLLFLYFPGISLCGWVWFPEISY